MSLTAKKQKVIQKRVYRGIKKLLSVEPLWFLKIKHKILDMSNPKLCVIGQLRGDFWKVIQGTAQENGITMDGEEADQCGFDLPVSDLDEDNYEKDREIHFNYLTELWISACKQLRSRWNEMNKKQLTLK